MREVRHSGLFCGMRTMKMATPAPTTMTSTTMTAVVLFAAATVVVVLPESSEGRRNQQNAHSFVHSFLFGIDPTRSFSLLYYSALA